MPKLASNLAREAEKAAEEGGPEIELLPEGIYVGQLFDVEVSDDEGPSGFHYWTWKFKIWDEGYDGKELRLITSLSPKAAFAIGGAFKAFGAAADTHTDELLGKKAMLHVSQNVISKGSRKGELSNRVDFLSPYTADGAATPLDEDF